MHLNELSPSDGAKKVGKRRRRGHSAGQGKTCGRGQKGQHARSGGYHKVGFEGGQMPLQRRLPKVGFTSRMAKKTAELRLHELAIPTDDVIDMDCLKKLHLVPATVTKVKEAGGQITAVPFGFPGGRRFHFHDPSGNELAVWSEK